MPSYGLSAEAVARYRTETELLTAAKRAEREITPELTARIADYASQAGEAAKRNEDLRESSRRTDELRSVGSDGVRTFVRGIADGASAAKTLDNVLSSIKSRIADLAANSLSDMLFGRRGTSDYGLLSNLLGSAAGGGNTAAAAASPSLADFFGGNFFPGFADGGIVGLSGTPGAVCGSPQGCGAFTA